MLTENSSISVFIGLYVDISATLQREVEACCSHVLATYGKSVRYLTNGCGYGSCGNDSDSDDDDYDDDMEGSDCGK